MWYLPNTTLEVPLSKTRGKGFTLMGALGNCIHREFFGKIVRSTNKEDFCDYLRELAPHITS